jgi:hypothetical protein
MTTLREEIKAPWAFNGWKLSDGREAVVEKREIAGNICLVTTENGLANIIECEVAKAFEAVVIKNRHMLVSLNDDQRNAIRARQRKNHANYLSKLKGEL